MIFEQKKLNLVGLQKDFAEMNPEAASALWQKFLPRLSEIKFAFGDVCYGVVQTHGKKTAYFCGIEVSSLDDIPHGMQVLVVPPSTYAKFKHIGPINNLSRTVQSIYSKWLPLCEWKHNEGPDLEIYEFNYQPMADDSFMYYAVPVK